jgi:phosphoribosylaminoimidazole (AIR) synthetase
MGIGMIAVVAPADLDRVRRAIPEETWVIGELISGERTVILK